LKALKSANNIGRADQQQQLQARIQAFHEVSNYANLARLEKERKDTKKARARQDLASKRQFEMQHGLAGKQLQKARIASENKECLQGEQFDYQKEHDTIADKDAAIGGNVQLRLQNINKSFEERHRDNEEFQARTRDNLAIIKAQMKTSTGRTEASQL
jgi:hypothetical protein